uniref:Uncharacterized protein n=1 Tax=Sus scrofa TaxID=9823 RepID=A0A8D2A4T8_PIG
PTSLEGTLCFLDARPRGDAPTRRLPRASPYPGCQGCGGPSGRESRLICDGQSYFFFHFMAAPVAYRSSWART